MTAPIDRDDLKTFDNQSSMIAPQASGRYSQIKAPLSACAVLEQMLSSKPRERFQTTGGGTGVSYSGNPVSIPRHEIRSVDEDTNSLFRAFISCERGLYQYTDEHNNSLFVTEDAYYDLMRQQIDNPPRTIEKCIIS